MLNDKRNFIFFNTFIVSGSKLKPETSLISFTPNLIPFFIISDFLVSKEIGIFFTIDFKISLILFHSSSLFTVFEPGLVDSPPTSIKSAPSLYSLKA